MLLQIADKTAVDLNSAQLNRSWLYTFLRKFKVSSKQPSNFTSAAKPFGSFMLPEENRDEFYRVYTEALDKGLRPHLTEKPGLAAPVLVDIDLRYPVETDSRMYTIEQIKEVARAYISALSQHVELSDQNAICYVFERSAPYMSFKKGQPFCVKDGWHMMFPFLNCNVELKLHVRELVLQATADVLHCLGATNALTDIIDKAVIVSNNWYVYGSGKPGLEAYSLTAILDRLGNSQPVELSKDLPKLLSVAVDKPNVNIHTAVPAAPTSRPRRAITRRKAEGACTTAAEEVNVDMLQRVIDGLDPMRCCNRMEWIEIIWAIYNISYINQYLPEGLQLAHSFSRKDPDVYDAAGVDKAWREAKYCSEGKQFGSLCRMLEEDDPCLLRQIQTPKKDYKTLKKEFELTHFKLLDPSGFVAVKESGTLPKSKRELMENYENLYYFAPEQGKMGEPPKLVRHQFLPKWFADETIRTYRTMDFKPPPQTCPSDVFNLFTGLRASSLPSDVEGNCLEQVWELHRRLCGNDRAVEADCLDYLAHMVQKPGELSRVALLFKSAEGVGKGMFLDFIGNAILGAEYYYSTTNPADLFDTFAVGLKHKLLVNLNEVDPQTANKYTERLKSAITDATINYQAKFVMTITISNFARWILSKELANSTSLHKADTGALWTSLRATRRSEGFLAVNRRSLCKNHRAHSVKSGALCMTHDRLTFCD